MMRILIIDDDKALCRSLQIHLEREGHEVSTGNTGESGLGLVSAAEIDAVFLDLNLPDASGLDLLCTITKAPKHPLVIMITGAQDARSTIDAIRYGAFDYIRKPLDLDTVLLTIEKASKQLRSVSKKARGQTVSWEPAPPHEIIGAHPAIIDVLKEIALVAESRVPVLIQGESGTGKELVARALHHTSHPDAPFVPVNCSAIVPTLLESELFGYVKGAFTGAESDKTGKLELAGSGTVFLDEIGDMPADLQAKLLRVLQEREFERVGSTKTIPFRARIVAATHRDLNSMIAGHRFREDLYYRLAVSKVRVPPLRDHKSDIPLLVEHMLGRLSHELHKEISGVEQDALNLCVAYDWPGNIRELNNVLTRAVLLSQGPVLSGALIKNAIGDSGAPASVREEIIPLREAEKIHVYKALLSTGWNIMRTAEILDISRVTLRKKIDDMKLRNPMDSGKL